ncbi:MAG: hypothetical protein GXW85_03850 [Clostridia bacterium]|nr:hypothetical protein [Clostridia bacterium]
MKFLFFLPTKRLAKDTALFAIGILIGAVLANLAIGYQVENLYRQNSDLKVQLSEKENQIQALEDQITEAKRWFVVQEIQIDLELPDRNFADTEKLKLNIQEQIKDLLKNVRGKRVNQLDPEVIWHIVDGRKLEALGYSFIIEVKGVIISEKLIFYVYAKYIDPERDDPV